MERLDESLTIPEIGDLLNVATVVEGQVQRSGDRLRINVQLIRTDDEDHLWAEIYDRDLTAADVFETQSAIARAVAGALHAQLSPRDEELLADVPTRNTEALDAFLTGQQLSRRGSFENSRRAERYLREAVRLDPEYAAAWSMIAYNSNKQLSVGDISIAEFVASAGPAVERALSIDQGLSQAHAVQGLVRWREGNIEDAHAAFGRAIELNPNNADSLRT